MSIFNSHPQDEFAEPFVEKPQSDPTAVMLADLKASYYWALLRQAGQNQKTTTINK